MDNIEVSILPKRDRTDYMRSYRTTIKDKVSKEHNENEKLKKAIHELEMKFEDMKKYFEMIKSQIV